MGVQMYVREVVTSSVRFSFIFRVAEQAYGVLRATPVIIIISDKSARIRSSIWSTIRSSIEESRCLQEHSAEGNCDE
jgi:hypothetical protein